MQGIIDFIKEYFVPRADIDFTFLLDFCLTVYKGLADLSSIVFGAMQQPLNKLLFPLMEYFPGIVSPIVLDYLKGITFLDVVLGGAFGIVLIGILWKWAREWLPW